MALTSQVAGHGRRPVPVVVPAVLVLHRCAGQLLGGCIVEARDIHRIERAAQLLDVGVAERLGAALLAEPVVDGVAAELVVRQRLLALLEPERRRHHDRLPEAILAAGRAVALAGALGEVDLAGEADRAAMAAAMIGLLHGQRCPARNCARRSRHSLQPSWWESRCSIDSKKAWRKVMRVLSPCSAKVTVIRFSCPRSPSSSQEKVKTMRSGSMISR